MNHTAAALAMNENSSEDELPAKKPRRPEELLEIRLLSAATGDTLLRLPKVDRSCKLGVLKEMIEAALRIPRPAQRLLFQTEELNQDYNTLGSLLPQDVRYLDLTIIKQQTPPDALFKEAQAGNGSTCLAMFQLPDIEELLQYFDEATQRSCLHAAAEQRLSATCLAILESPHFPHLNLESSGRMTALHAAIRSDLPDVCRAILSRSDYQGRARDANIGELSVLHFAILYRHVAALQAMVSRLSICQSIQVPLLSRDALIEPFPDCRFWANGWKMYEGCRPQQVCEQMGLTEAAKAISEKAPMPEACSELCPVAPIHLEPREPE